MVSKVLVILRGWQVRSEIHLQKKKKKGFLSFGRRKVELIIQSDTI